MDLVIPEGSWDQKRTDMHEYSFDTFVMGDDWEGKFDFLRDEDVEVIYLPRTPENSTSSIMKDLHALCAKTYDSKFNHNDIDLEPSQ